MKEVLKKLFTPTVGEHCKELSAKCDELSLRLVLTPPQVALSLSTMIAALIMEHYTVADHRTALDAVADMIEGELEGMVEFDAKDHKEVES